ncbi:hypothetical protein BKA70DRAFT_1223591 [Coprinopsis sp. MPI-PUGE-AT-0042]|nr:hypothetical protein BKA70DRAFT_1223591 [Coprinopsis sp. MPI-PUGE-AT-0042]
MPKDTTPSSASSVRSSSRLHSRLIGSTLSAPPLPKRRGRASVKPILAASEDNLREAAHSFSDVAQEASTISETDVAQESAPAGGEEVEALAKALARANRCANTKKKLISKIRRELADTKEELGELSSEMDELKERLEKAESETSQYRNWWLNEVQFTKLILTKVPNANQDWDLLCGCNHAFKTLWIYKNFDFRTEAPSTTIHIRELQNSRPQRVAILPPTYRTCFKIYMGNGKISEFLNI